MKNKGYKLLTVFVVLVLVLLCVPKEEVSNKEKVSESSDSLIVMADDSPLIATTTIIPGWTSTKTFTIRNESSNAYVYNIQISGLINTFVTSGNLQYMITSTNEGYNMASWADVPKSETAKDTVLTYAVEIPVGTTQSYTLKFRYLENVDSSADQDKVFNGVLSIKTGSYLSFYDKLLTDNPTRLTRSSFSSFFTDVNTGTLYSQNGAWTEDLNGDGTGETVYYFSGNAQNNWVKFGKTNESSCTYNGSQVVYGNLTTLQMKTGTITESECTSTNICKVTASDGTVTYGTGLTESQCNDSSLAGILGSGNTYTYINEKATFSSSVKDIYWRILRTNEDGGIRLLYAGTSPNTTKGYLSTYVAFNMMKDESYHDKYIGYMYGTDGSLDNHRTNSNSSTIKTFLDSWYSKDLTSLNDGTYAYDSYVSKTSVFCNDRSTSGWYSQNTSRTYFGAQLRLAGSKQPSYKCGNDPTGTLYSTASVKDKFSVSTSSGGNGDLSYPIGLITADEIAYAGGKVWSASESISSYPWYQLNSESKIITGDESWWTMSPSFLGVDGAVYVYSLIKNDTNFPLFNVSFNTFEAVRPVLSLKGCTYYKKGDGSSSSPYEVKIDYNCAMAEN